MASVCKHRFFLWSWSTHSLFSFRKHRCIRITAGLQISNQIKHFVFVERVDQAIWHHRNFRNQRLFNCIARNVGHIARVEHVFADHDLVVVQIHDATRDLFTGAQHKDAGFVLIGNHFARFNDGFQHRTSIVTTRHRREFGANDTAISGKAMTFVTRSHLKHFSSIDEVAFFESRFNVGEQIIDLPFPEDWSRRRFNQIRGTCRLSFQNFLESSFVGITQMINCFLTNVFDEARERIAASKGRR